MLDFSITVEELKNKQGADSSLVILDVRESSEFEELPPIEGSLNIPLKDLSLQALLEAGIDRKTELVIYCRSGRRGSVACQTLYCQDFLEVKNLEGGVEAWIETHKSLPY